MRRCTVYTTTTKDWGDTRVRLEGWLVEVHKRGEYSMECIVANERGHLSCHGSDYVRVHVPVMLDLMTGRPAAAHEIERDARLARGDDSVR